MLLFLRDADVVDEWLRTQQNLLSDDLQSPTTFDIDRTQRDIIDIERRQGIVQILTSFDPGWKQAHELKYDFWLSQLKNWPQITPKIYHEIIAN